MSTTTNEARITMTAEEFAEFIKGSDVDPATANYFAETAEKPGSVHRDVPVEKSAMTKAFEKIDAWWGEHPGIGFIIFAGVVSIGSYALCRHLLTGSIYKANVKTLKYQYKLG